jgi:hypothetical protein
MGDDVGGRAGAALPGDRDPGQTNHLTRPEALALADATEAMRGQYDNPWLTCAKSWPDS